MPRVNFKNPVINAKRLPIKKLNTANMHFQDKKVKNFVAPDYLHPQNIDYAKNAKNVMKSLVSKVRKLFSK